MADYKAMYLRLFNRVSDAITFLQEAQKESEDAYIESEDAIITALPKKGETDED